ncbi:MAG: hypothetical protein F4222_02035 [Gammaproteobacteria bacterium]|nr:hypothetical protein [Gammaproteobacteria bacterium]
MTVTDDDEPALVLSATTLGVAEGGSAEYSVRLATQPAANVTVSISGHADTDLTLDRDSLTFRPADWNELQTVTASAGQDDDASDDTATLAHTASGGDYGSLTAEVTVTVEDDDDDGAAAALVLSETAVAMTEGAGTSYTVSLATRPTDTVTVSIAGHAGTDLSLGRTSLTFRTTDWDEPQTVTVSAARDADEDEDTATLVHTATGGGYDGIAAELAVTVRDGIKISLAAGEAIEGSFMEVRFTLSSPSPGDVEVSWLTHPGGGSAHAGPVDDPIDFRMASGRLRFAAGETEIVREVWIVEDDIDDPHEQFTVQIDRPRGAVLADPVTSIESLAQPDRRIELGREIAYVVVTILQAEAAAEPLEVTLEASPPTLEEGGRTLLWARLAEPLPEPVRIPLVWSAGTAEPDDHDGPSGLTIYAGDLTGRATLNASEDDDADDETLSVSFGELPGWVVAGTPDSVEIAILDNDGGREDFSGLTVSVADASAYEGEENLRFPVTLNRPAPGPVTVQASIDPTAGKARRGLRGHVPAGALRGRGPAQVRDGAGRGRPDRRGRGDAVSGAERRAAKRGDDRAGPRDGHDQERRPDAGGVAGAVRAHGGGAGAGRGVGADRGLARAGLAGLARRHSARRRTATRRRDGRGERPRRVRGRPLPLRRHRGRAVRTTTGRLRAGRRRAGRCCAGRLAAACRAAGPSRSVLRRAGQPRPCGADRHGLLGDRQAGRGRGHAGVLGPGRAHGVRRPRRAGQHRRRGLHGPAGGGLRQRPLAGGPGAGAQLRRRRLRRSTGRIGRGGVLVDGGDPLCLARSVRAALAVGGGGLRRGRGGA